MALPWKKINCGRPWRPPCGSPRPVSGNNLARRHTARSPARRRYCFCIASLSVARTRVGPARRNGPRVARQIHSGRHCTRPQSFPRIDAEPSVRWWFGRRDENNRSSARYTHGDKIWRRIKSEPRFIGEPASIAEASSSRPVLSPQPTRPRITSPIRCFGDLSRRLAVWRAPFSSTST